MLNRNIKFRATFACDVRYTIPFQGYLQISLLVRLAGDYVEAADGFMKLPR